MNNQGTMRTRNTRKPGQTPPPKKGSKTPVKGDSPAQPSAATEAAAEVVETKLIPESVGVKPEAKTEVTTEEEPVKSSLEANGDGKKAEVRPTKVLSPASAKKQKKATPKKTAVVAGEGAAEVESKEAVSTQSEDDYKDSEVAVSTEVTDTKVPVSSSETIEIKDDDADEGKTETEPATEMEVEDAAGDDEMEEVAEEDGDEEVEEEGEEDGDEEVEAEREGFENEVEEEEEEEEDEGEEGVQNEEGIENEVEEEENEEGDEEEEEEGGEEDVEGEEVEGGDIAQEHPELQESRPVTERQKRKQLEVFVGGLDKEATEDDVKKAFENVGEVVEVRLMRNPHTGKNKGYAFVRFATTEQAARAATELNRTEIKGKSCAIVPSEDNDVLFLGNINKSWKVQQVEEKLKEYGIDGIEELTVMEDPQNEGMNRGFAFVELATHNDAVKAFKLLAKPNAVFGSDRSAKVAWAHQNEPDEAVMSQVKSVFVDGILSSWEEEKVKELFGTYGEIERIVLARNIPRSKRNDFAFVNYATRDAAVACIDALKDNELADGENKIKVKVKLAKPQPKGRAGKDGVRGGYPLDRSVRPGRGRGGATRGRIERKPIRGGRGLVRGGSRPFGRGRRTYEVLPAHKLPKGMRQRELEERPYHMERFRDRRPLGGPLRPSRVPLRGGFARREDVRRGRAGYSGRPNYEYRGRHDDIRDDYPPPPPPPRGGGYSESLPSRRGHSVRHPPPPPRDDGYLRRADRGYDYGRDASGGFSRGRDFGEPGPGMKRPYSSLEEDGYYESAPRGYSRARINYDVPPPPSQYESVRAPLGRSGHGIGAGRAPAPPLPVSQSSLGIYDQPGALSGGGGGSGSLYGSGNHGYGSALSGAGDYTSSGAEIRGSALYGNRSASGGYGYPGAGSGSYY